MSSSSLEGLVKLCYDYDYDDDCYLFIYYINLYERPGGVALLVVFVGGGGGFRLCCRFI